MGVGGERGDLGFCGNSTKKCVGVSNSVKNCDKGTPFYSSKIDTHLLDANTSVDLNNMTFKGNWTKLSSRPLKMVDGFPMTFDQFYEDNKVSNVSMFLAEKVRNVGSSALLFERGCP